MSHKFIEHYFGNCKVFKIPAKAVYDCSRPGDVSEVVEHWVQKIEEWPSEEDMIQDLKESGVEYTPEQVKILFLWIACCSCAEAIVNRRRMKLI